MATFVIPAGTAPRLCRGCQLPIYWITTRAGKKLCLELGAPNTYSPGPNHDGAGTAHWGSCTAAAQFRRPRPPGPPPAEPRPRPRKDLD